MLYPVLETTQGTLHFTHWQMCSFQPPTLCSFQHQHHVHSNTNTVFIPMQTLCSFQHQHCVHSNANTMFIPTPTPCSLQHQHCVHSNTNTIPCSFQHHALSNNNNTTFIPTLTRHLREVFKYVAITARRLFIYMSIALSIAMYSLIQLSELRQLMRGE